MKEEFAMTSSRDRIMQILKRDDYLRDIHESMEMIGLYIKGLKREKNSSLY